MMRRFWSLLVVLLLASCISTPCPAAVTADIARSQYTASGSAAFLFDFPVWDDDEILVYAGGSLVASSLYSLSYTAGDASGGTVTFTTAPASGTIVTIVRRAEQARTTDFSTSGPFSMSTLNTQVDRLTTQVQDLQEQIDRSLRYKVSNTSTFPYSVPEAEWPAPQGSRLLGYDGSALPMLYTPDNTGSTNILNAIRQTTVATQGQAAFTTSFTYVPGSAELAVYVNGVRQVASAYTETDGTTVTMSEGLDAGDLVEFVFNGWQGTDVSDSQLRTDLATVASGYGGELVANVPHVYTALYSFSVDGGAAGDIDLGVEIPDNAIITRVIAEETTAFTSGGSATITVYSGPNASGQALTNAIAFDSGFTGVNSLALASSATGVKMTAARNLSLYVQTADLTAGVCYFMVEWFTGH